MQITIGNSVIPLSPGTNLPLVLRSPLFLTDQGKIPGSYIFNFPVPAGEAIRQVFAQAHRVQKGSYTTTDLPYVITNGSVRYAGSCIVTQASRDTYEIACKIDNGDFSGKLYGKMLSDLDFGGDIQIADIYSSAQIPTITYEYTYAGYHEFLVNSLFSIICDITGSMSNSGLVFTSPSTITMKQKIYVSAIFFRGSLQLTLTKNSIQYYQETINSLTPHNYIDYTIDLSLTAGDVIELILLVQSEGVQNEGEDISLTLERCSIEYSTTNIFTSNVALDQYETDYAVFPTLNAEFLSEFPDDGFLIDNLSIKTLYTVYFPVLNYFKNGEFPFMLNGTTEGENMFAANLFTPFIYMRTILNKIASESGYSIVNNPFDTDYFQGMVLFNAYAENMYVGDLASLVPIKPTFNLANHVPILAQSDFLKAVSLLTGYMPMVDNNLQTLTFVDLKRIHLVSNTNVPVKFPGILLETPIITIEPEYKGIKLELTKAGNDQYLDHIKELNEKLIYKGQVDHLSELPASGNLVNDMYLVLESNEYYVYQYNPETYTLTWWFFSKNFPIIYTEGVEPFFELTINLCPILTTHFRDETLGCPENRYWILPKTEQAGILEGFPDSLATECGFQVLYYKGMVHDSLGEDYPLGSSRRADFSEIETYPDLSARSIFENRYMYFLRWLAYETKLVTFKAILSPSQLNSLSFSQLYAASDTFFLLKEIRINLELDGFSLAEIDMYVC